MANEAYEKARNAEAVDLADKLQSAISLAAANFPSTADLRLQTVGANPYVSLVICPYALKRLVNAGRAALARHAASADGEGCS